MSLLPSTNFEPKYLSKVTSWHPFLPFAYDLMIEVKPYIFVELGTHWGDSYFTFCQSRKANKLSTKCFAIDHWEGDEHSGFYDNRVFESVYRYNEENYSSFSKLKRKRFEEAAIDFEDQSIDLLHIDGHHSLESINCDFKQWIPKVKPHGLILIHDTLVTKSDFGVFKFWEKISTKYLSYNFNFSFGLGLLRNCSNTEYQTLVNPIFDEIIKSRYYQNVGQKLVTVESR